MLEALTGPEIVKRVRQFEAWSGPVESMGPEPWKPTREQVAAALDATVPDLIAPGLLLLFSGINPSLYSAAVGHHFARPGNRFWPTLHAAGFTPRLFSPFEERSLLDLGIGITNFVGRATAAAEELSREELAEGGRVLEGKLRRFRPAIVAFLGITAYRSAFQRPHARMGPQEESISGTRLWVLPNPSGRNGHFRLGPFLELRQAFETAAGPRSMIPRLPSAS